MATTIIESLFQRSLEDMVKGLRVQMIGEAAFLSKALDEVKKEIKSTDVSTKSVALQKLTYLNMLQGTDMAWASFHVLEVMSMPKFSIKKIGYLAASQSFSESTDVLLLITNLLRKDFGGKNEYETSLAIECLSRVATPDLARDLMPELFTMLASGRVLVRKKATIALARVFSSRPDAIRVALKRLIERLGDSDPSVATAAISVLCDLAVKDPKPFLPLAPELYNLLVQSPSNWLCIKLVKILGILAPVEPRLGKKIADPILQLMRKSEAKSVLLECIQTVISGLPQHQEAITLSVEKLSELLNVDDTNLKYLCLRALANLMPVHPWAVGANKEAIAQCLNHRDPSIQKGARRLIIGMVSESNVMATVQVLLQYAHSADADSCNELLSDILSTCSSDNYGLISDFSWYVSVLATMARIPHCGCGDEIGRQLSDVGFRVKSATAEVLKAGRELLLDPCLLDRNAVHGVLAAAAWIAGEYVAYSADPFELVQALLQPRTALLPFSVRALYVQAVFKIFVYSSARYFNLAPSMAHGNEAEGISHGEALSEGQDLPETEFILENEATTSEFQPFQTAHLGEMATDIQPNGMKLPLLTEDVGSRFGQDSNLAFSQQNQDNDLSEHGLQPEIVMNVAGDRETTANSSEGGVSMGEKQDFAGILEPMMDLITENVGPLVKSFDVEVQERASHLLGFLQAMKDISPTPWPYHADSPEAQDFINLLDAMMAVFAVELSPVSTRAQSRVTAPEGLTLENLDALGPFDTNQDMAEGILGRDAVPEWEERKLISFQTNNSATVGEGAALLAQHRQRHQSFYLPSEGDARSSSLGYPPPLISSTDPAARSTAQFKGSFNLDDEGRSTRSKARPAVVKLDDDDEDVQELPKVKKDLKDEFISNAIMDVLSGSARSTQRDHAVSQGIEGEPARTRRHRSHGSRSSRHSEKANGNDGARAKGAGMTFKMDGTLYNAPEPSSSSRRHRSSRHERKAVMSVPTAEVESQNIKSLNTRGKSRQRRAGDHGAGSPEKGSGTALPVRDDPLRE